MVPVFASHAWSYAVYSRSRSAEQTFSLSLRNRISAHATRCTRMSSAGGNDAVGDARSKLQDDNVCATVVSSTSSEVASSMPAALASAAVTLAAAGSTSRRRRGKEDIAQRRSPSRDSVTRHRTSGDQSDFILDMEQASRLLAECREDDAVVMVTTIQGLEIACEIELQRSLDNFHVSRGTQPGQCATLRGVGCVVCLLRDSVHSCGRDVLHLMRKLETVMKVALLFAVAPASVDVSGSGGGTEQTTFDESLAPASWSIGMRGVAKWTGVQSAQQGSSIARLVGGLPVFCNQKATPAFRVSCNRGIAVSIDGKQSEHLTHQQTAAAIAGGLEMAFGWRADVKSYDLDVVLRPVSGGCLLGVALTSEMGGDVSISAAVDDASDHTSARPPVSCHSTFGSAWSWADLPCAGMKPSLASAMALAADIKAGATVLDPMCGTGMTLLAAARRVAADGAPQQLRLVGVDEDAGQLGRCAQNFIAAGIIFEGAGSELTLTRCEVRALLGREAMRDRGNSQTSASSLHSQLLAPESVDAVICDVPCGQRCLSTDRLSGVYRRLVHVATRLVRTGGRLVLLSTRGDLLELAVASARQDGDQRSPAWQLISEWSVRRGKTSHSSLLVWERL